MTGRHAADPFCPTLGQPVWFRDGKAVHGALVPAREQGDAARVVVNVAVAVGDAGALQGDVRPVAAQRRPPCEERKCLPGVTYRRPSRSPGYSCEVVSGCSSKYEGLNPRGSRPRSQNVFE